MPFINANINVELSMDAKKALKEGFGRIISDIPTKNEEWLMVSIEDDCYMTFRGSAEPCAMIDVSVFGPSSDDAYAKHTADACELVSKITGIPKDRIYIKYSEYSHWGWNSINF